MELNQSTNRTLKTVLRDKALDHVANHPISHVFYKMGKLLLVITGVGFSVDHKWMMMQILKVLSWYHGIIPNIILWSFVIFRWTSIKNTIRWFLGLFTVVDEPGGIIGTQKIGNTFEGVSVEALLDVFASNVFSRKEVCSYLNINRGMYNRLMEAFEDVGMLTRGENNTLVHNKEMFSMGDIEDVLTKNNSILKMIEDCRHDATERIKILHSGREIYPTK